MKKTMMFMIVLLLGGMIKAENNIEKIVKDLNEESNKLLSVEDSARQYLNDQIEPTINKIIEINNTIDKIKKDDLQVREELNYVLGLKNLSENDMEYLVYNRDYGDTLTQQKCSPYYKKILKKWIASESENLSKNAQQMLVAFKQKYAKNEPKK